jgi:hypothetical protein
MGAIGRPTVGRQIANGDIEMRQLFIAALVIAVLAIGGGLIATTAYQAGVAANITVVGAGAGTTTDGTVVAPVVVPAYGWGWGWHGFGPGFGFFGFLFAIFFILLLVGLIRAIAFGGRRGWGRGWGPGGPGSWGGPNGDHGTHPWEARAHQTFDEWHRSAHSEPGSAAPASGQPGSDQPR